MTASEKSIWGLAKQTAKGTPNVTDANFSYMLFTEGVASPQNLNLPLDQEIGGGAMLRSVIKAGVTSLSQLTFIPRPDIIGHMLFGALGASVAPVSNPGGSKKHVFNQATDQFSAPYFTVRSSPGGLFGEQFQDMRVAALGFNWKAADYLRGTLGMIGGLPKPSINMATWAPATYLDDGPQFLATLGTVEIPAATAVKCLRGSFTIGLDIPMDEQWIVGSYYPDDFAINSRAAVVSLLLKIEDETLYKKMMYDPASGTSWLADVMKEGDITLSFASDVDAGTAEPYLLQFKGNGQSGADANITWTISPIGLRAGRQVTAVVTGTFLASPTADESITVELTNTHATQY
jgi:hypothetical protein